VLGLVLGLGVSVRVYTLRLASGFIFCVYFVSAKPVAAGILAEK